MGTIADAEPGFFLIHAPTSVVGSEAPAVYNPTPQPRCGLINVMPIRIVVLAAMLLYVSLTTNFMTFSSSVTRAIVSHAYIRIGLVFLLSFFIIDYNGPFRLLPRIATAALITLIYQVVIGLADDPKTCGVLAVREDASARPSPSPSSSSSSSPSRSRASQRSTTRQGVSAQPSR